MGDLEPEWENLPELCLFMVLDKLDALCNMVQFGAVCKHWHSVFNDFLDSRRRSSPNVVPMLLIPTSQRSKTKRKLYSLQAKAEVCDIELPNSHIMRCCGSCYGWLAMVNKNMDITLSTPFKDVSSIDLPKFEFQYAIQKVVLSADPSSNQGNYAVVVIYGESCDLALYKSGNEAWIYIDENLEWFTDIIFYRSLCYAIGYRGTIVSFDVDSVPKNGSKSPKVILVHEEQPEVWSHRAYLVESSKGNLYSIHKERDDKNLDVGAYYTKGFKVFKLVLDDRSGELLKKEEVKSMDGDVVFVGHNKSLAVSALYFPGAQPNSIYFTDDYSDVTRFEPFGPRDIGIFNLKDGSRGDHYQFQPSHKKLPPYIWIQLLPPAHHHQQVEENKLKSSESAAATTTSKLKKIS